MKFLNSVAPIFILTLILFFTVIQSADSQNFKDSSGKLLPVIKEAFHTDRDEGDNVDSPAIWHGYNGENWLLATAKEGNTIIAYDANDGSLIERFGEGGEGQGQFERPNGIAVIDDLVLVVERDNQRVQVFTLPEFESIGHFGNGRGDDGLKLPYGLAIDKIAENTYEVFVSDNYNPSLMGYPPEEELDQRIQHFRFTVHDNSLESEHLKSFGAISGEGVLRKVESLWTDRDNNRLLISEEAYSDRSIKEYDLEGNYKGKVVTDKYIDSEPEGIALYKCSDGSGYWIFTDQHETDINKFQVFDRETLNYIGGYKGEITRNTDGIWLTQKSFGDFEHGAFYPVHDDGSVTAISWTDIADALSLKNSCTQ